MDAIERLLDSDPAIRRQAMHRTYPLEDGVGTPSRWLTLWALQVLEWGRGGWAD
jgi:hypothetical protein